MKRSRISKMIALALAIGAVSFLGLQAAAPTLDKPNLSGDWVLNLEKSKLQTQMKLDSATFTIDHKEPDFHFSRVFVVGGKEDVFSYSLTTDGKEKVEEQPDRTLYNRLYWDGDVLVFDVRIVLKNGREATNVVRYSLRDGGRTFVAEEKFRGAVVKYDNLWVADRKI
jgi:hypothetical protein